jgi:CheY-like chemotaxis protein
MNKDAKIVIVENNDGHTTLIEKNLVRSGIENEIIRFSDGQDVLDFFKKDASGSFVILLDVSMPGTDGITVLKWFKNNSTYQKIPIIMLTTSDDPKTMQQCEELGCTKYIVKPISYNDFVSTVKDLVSFISEIEVPTITL